MSDREMPLYMRAIFVPDVRGWPGDMAFACPFCALQEPASWSHIHIASVDTRPRCDAGTGEVGYVAMHCECEEGAHRWTITLDQHAGHFSARLERHQDRSWDDVAEPGEAAPNVIPFTRPDPPER